MKPYACIRRLGNMVIYSSRTWAAERRLSFVKGKERKKRVELARTDSGLRMSRLKGIGVGGCLYFLFSVQRVGADLLGS